MTATGTLRQSWIIMVRDLKHNPWKFFWKE